MNKLWLGFDLEAAIAAPILHVDSQGQVDYEPSFSQVRPQPKPPVHAARSPFPGDELSCCLGPGTLELWVPSGVENAVAKAPGLSCGRRGREQSAVRASPRQALGTRSCSVWATLSGSSFSCCGLSSSCVW